MQRILSIRIALWYVLIIVTLCNLVGRYGNLAKPFLPSNVYAKLKLPTIIPVADNPVLRAYAMAIGQPPSDLSTVLVGDSVAAIAPWGYVKIFSPAEGSLDLTTRIAAFRPVQTPDRFVIMTGTWLLYHGESEQRIADEIEKIRASIALTFPSAEIIIIPPESVHTVSATHSIDGGWHPDEEGYKILHDSFLLHEYDL